MVFWEPRKVAMFLGNKAPCFLCRNALEQLDANAVHLSGMKQGSFFRALLFECDGSRMQTIVTDLAQRYQIGFLIASLLTAENDVMDLQASIFRFPLALLAGVAIPREHVGFGIGKRVVDALLVQPLALQHFGIFERMRIEGSCLVEPQ